MPRFDHPIRAAELASLVDGALHGADVLLRGVAPLSEAGPDELAFADGTLGLESGAGLVIAAAPRQSGATLLVDDPMTALAAVLVDRFHEPRPHRGDPAIHPDAQVHPRAVVHPGVVIGPDVVVEADTVLFPNVVLYPRTRVGARVRIHAGAVIGADGFRYHAGKHGLVKVPHVGGVRIEDDVEIGANACVDRGMLTDTLVGRGAKIDNLVQVGHNCVVGPYAILVAQVGLSGSVTVGAGAVLAGQVGVKDHVHIGAGARLGARSAVHGDVPHGETWLGEPARPVKEAMRVYAALRYLPELVRRMGRS